MAPAATFSPPAATLPGKPSVPEWIPPPITKETHNFAQLKSIDLSLLDSEDPAVVDHLVSQVKQAIREDGFLFLENYGISIEQLHRQFALAQYLYKNISDEDKQRLLFDPETGIWSGYKHPFGFKVRLTPHRFILTTTNSPFSVTAAPKMASNSSTGTSPTGKISIVSQHAYTRSWTRSKSSATTSPNPLTAAYSHFSPVFWNCQMTISGTMSSRMEVLRVRATSVTRCSGRFRSRRRKHLKDYACTDTQISV